MTVTVLQSPSYLNGFGNGETVTSNENGVFVAISILPKWLRQPPYSMIIVSKSHQLQSPFYLNGFGNLNRCQQRYFNNLLQSPFYLNGFGNFGGVTLWYWFLPLQSPFYLNGFGNYRDFTVTVFEEVVAIPILPKWLRQRRSNTAFGLKNVLQSPFYLNGFGNRTARRVRPRRHQLQFPFYLNGFGNKVGEQTPKFSKQ